MSLHQVFERFTSDEFPPEYVFCLFNDKVHSILSNEIGIYDTMYKFVNRDNPENLPELGRK